MLCFFYCVEKPSYARAYQDVEASISEKMEQANEYYAKILPVHLSQECWRENTCFLDPEIKNFRLVSREYNQVFNKFRKTLKISMHRLHVDNIDVFKKYIPKLTTLERLILDGDDDLTKLDTTKATMLATVFEQLTKLENLNLHLRWNYWNSSHAVALSTALKKLPKLTHLNVVLPYDSDYLCSLVAGIGDFKNLSLALAVLVSGAGTSFSLSVCGCNAVIAIPGLFEELKKHYCLILHV